MVRAQGRFLRPPHVGRVAEPQDERHRPDRRDESPDGPHGRRHLEIPQRPALQPDHHRPDGHEHRHDEMAHDGCGQQHRRQAEALPLVEGPGQGPEEEEAEADGDAEGELAGQGAGQIAAPDRVAGVEEVGQRGHGEQRRRRPAGADAPGEGIGGDRQHDRPEDRHQLEGHVVGQEDVEDDDEQRWQREVEDAGREAGVPVGRPARQAPLGQNVVAQEGRPPHVRAGVAAVGGGVGQQQVGLQGEPDVERRDRRRDEADPALAGGQAHPFSMPAAIRPPGSLRARIAHLFGRNGQGGRLDCPPEDPAVRRPSGGGSGGRRRRSPPARRGRGPARLRPCPSGRPPHRCGAAPPGRPAGRVSPAATP